MSPEPYVLKISRLTIDKLGVKLYDRASAVVAELVANSYDADADRVSVKIPLATWLGRKLGTGVFEDRGYEIQVIDDGHGMTPKEAQEYFLNVGRDRRMHDEQGSRSREKRRPVMGRKGIGKLAPFGICKRIEVVSAGGEPTADGYLVSNFVMDFDKLMVDTDDSVELERGTLDRSFQEKRGTTVVLSDFINKRVPDSDTFFRQLSVRFGLGGDDFTVEVEDTRNPDAPARLLKPIDIPTVEKTLIDLAGRPVPLDGEEPLEVTGWMALAQHHYKHEELTGVRIYSRGKIVATTRDFEQPSGFTGEFTMRSYLVGEVCAEWLDLDEGEDLIRTDRQGILWESDYGRALRSWGADLIKEIAAKSRGPRRQRVSEVFLEKSGFKEKAEARFTDRAVLDTAMDLAKRIGAFAAEDELTDESYVNELAEVVLSVAPHKALIEAFREFNELIAEDDHDLDRLMDLFGKTRIAEMASYAQIAAERVEAIERLEEVIAEKEREPPLQRLIEGAPWLIDPSWSVITKNQALSTFMRAFNRFWEDRHGKKVSYKFDASGKRPDFIAVDIGNRLHIVEIKAIAHTFDDSDFLRLVNYADGFSDFFESNSDIKQDFPRGWIIDLVADKVELKKPSNRIAFDSLMNDKGLIRRSTWEDFLSRARRSHEQFIDARDRAAEGAAKEDG